MPGWPHPALWPQGMWVQGGKWVRAGLELTSLGPMTPLPCGGGRVTEKLLSPPKDPLLLFFFPWETKNLGSSVSEQEELGDPPQWTEEREPHKPGWRFCTKESAPPTPMGRQDPWSAHLTHARQLWRQMEADVLLLVPGSGTGQGWIPEGRVHSGTAQSRRLFCLVWLQLGKSRNPSPRGICPQHGPCVLFIISGLSLWIPLPHLCLCVPFWRNDGEMGRITPGQGHQVSLGPASAMRRCLPSLPCSLSKSR